VSNPEGIATGLEAGPKVDERDTTTFIDYEPSATVQAFQYRTFITGDPPSALRQRRPAIGNEFPKPYLQEIVRHTNQSAA
jgi:hypothetical protein